MKISNRYLKLQYIDLFHGEVREYTLKRVNSGISQQAVADTAGVSLRTIQRFERYGVIDAYILYVYKKMLS